MNEEFEKYYKYIQSIFPLADKPSLKAAFKAGAAAMREKCAEVADNEANGFRNTRIAAAIRKIGVE